MIPQSALAAVLVCVSVLQGISGAAYSNVFVQSGADIVPVEYVNYGAPALPVAGSQIAQISVAPASVPAVMSPCVAPCVIPGAPIPAVAPISSTANAKIVAYKSPIANVPVVLANKDDAASYQYAYAVYDESTGDKKTQSEQSDGSVVQGQYSFIQPDGYRREVVYTADDLKGFNAIVKNFLPESDNSKSAKKDGGKVDKKNLPPCNDLKSEQLNVPPAKEDTSPDSGKPNGSSEVEQIEVTSQPPQQPASQPATQASATPDPNANAVVSYNDVIKCLQSKLQTNNNPSGISPLTYILIPSLSSFGNPC